MAHPALQLIHTRRGCSVVVALTWRLALNIDLELQYHLPVPAVNILELLLPEGHPIALDAIQILHSPARA